MHPLIHSLIQHMSTRPTVSRLSMDMAPNLACPRGSAGWMEMVNRRQRHNCPNQS